MESVAIYLIYFGLRPTAAPRHLLIDDSINHVTDLEVFAPFLVGRADALEFLFGDLVVVVVQDRIILKDVFHTVEKHRHVLTKLEQGHEQTSVILQDTCHHFQILDKIKLVI